VSGRKTLLYPTPPVSFGDKTNQNPFVLFLISLSFDEEQKKIAEQEFQILLPLRVTVVLRQA
jgi:hypothetical protein